MLGLLAHNSIEFEFKELKNEDSFEVVYHEYYFCVCYFLSDSNKQREKSIFAKKI